MTLPPRFDDVSTSDALAPDQLTNPSRAALVSTAFVKIANARVGEYDALDVLRTLVDQCVLLLDVTAATVMLADQDGDLRVLATTSGASHYLESLQHRIGSGPCAAAYRSGTVVAVSDVDAEIDKYPALRSALLTQNFQSLHAIPLQLCPDRLGVLSLFRTQKGLLTVEDEAIGRALADVAAISLLHERTAKEIAAVNAQLRQALHSRVLIEQAKGVIATRDSVTMDEAFKRLRNYSRAHQKPMHLSAADVIRNHIMV